MSLFKKIDGLCLIYVTLLNLFIEILVQWNNVVTEIGISKF
jgi:hypothetical protein